MQKYMTEFIGTFFLVLTIGLAANPGGVGPLAPLAIGASLMVMVYMGGHVSGAHYNPAVSVAVLIRGKMKKSDFLPYLVAQIVAAIVAAYAASAIMGKPTVIAPNPKASIGMALMVEILYTFALALVILNVATAKETSGNSFYGLAIGFTVCAAAFAGGGISGGAFNPAVGLGLIVAGGGWNNAWLYIVGPILGGAGAAAVFLVQHPEALKDRA